jgi:outer membrane protein OmpA-like peptidoglycan-associated protein/tetratricopeptide (TPR) repeat protein
MDFFRPGPVILSVILFFLILLTCPCKAQQNTPCNKVFNKKVEKLYDEGIAFYMKGNYTETLKRMKSVISQEPEFTDAWYLIGLINFKRYNSNFKEAERSFLKVVELCPGYDPYVYYYLGEICYGDERFDSTVRYLSEFVRDVDKIKSDKDYNRAMDLLRYSEFYLQVISKPVPFEPKVVEGISTVGNEYLAILSPDNQMALFTREIKLIPDMNSLFQTIKEKEKFMFSLIQNDGTFSDGEEMPEPFNLNDNEGGATLTIDNNTLYYTVCKYTKNNTYYNCDIFFSEYVNEEWTKIKSVSDKINQSTTWESQPSISSDGRTLYFISDRPGGYGGYDIYKAVKNEKEEWGYSVNLGPKINSSGDEKSPFIHPDDKTLYFSSDGRMGLGGFDIFYSRLDSSGNWSRPKNIGYPINSREDEIGFFVSTDGTHGFFASNKLRGKGGWDLYSFDLYPEARPEKVLFIKGTVRSEAIAEPVKARIELKNLETKKISEIPLDTTTGKYVAIAPFNDDYIMTVKKEGYVYETRYISRIDSIFKTPAQVDVEIEPIELNKSYRINDIYFDFNKYDLTHESMAVLDQLIEFLNENPKIRIQIQGHTDNIGNDADNLRLSDNRARSVYIYLVDKGINSNRITYKGFGKTMPVANNDTEEGRARNRRTVFIITGK